jgi:hypothetical protein
LLFDKIILLFTKPDKRSISDLIIHKTNIGKKDSLFILNPMFYYIKKKGFKRGLGGDYWHDPLWGTSQQKDNPSRRFALAVFSHKKRPQTGFGPFFMGKSRASPGIIFLLRREWDSNP